VPKVINDSTRGAQGNSVATKVLKVIISSTDGVRKVIAGDIKDHWQLKGHPRFTGYSPLPHTIQGIMGLTSVSTPLQLNKWRQCLHHHPDHDFTNYIIWGNQYGFHIGAKSPATLVSANKNMSTTRNH